MSRRQCAKCPWKRETNPHEIPAYDVRMHRTLASTIADPGSLRVREPKMMACHETPVGAEQPCVGWLVHQLGPGNNLPLRLRAMAGEVDADVATVGPQHERFEDTLPGGVQ